MKIAIFCSANSAINPEYFRLTALLGTWLGQHGHTIVYGGCRLGLMECVARAARAAGGHTLAVVPRLVEERGEDDDADITIPCENLSDRKDLMLAHADLLLALPGGIGTLDEVFTVAAAATCGYHRKRVVLCNFLGFWDTTIAMLDDMERRGMTRGPWRNIIATADTVEDVEEMIGSRE